MKSVASILSFSHYDYVQPGVSPFVSPYGTSNVMIDENPHFKPSHTRGASFPFSSSPSSSSIVSLPPYNPGISRLCPEPFLRPEGLCASFCHVDSQCPRSWRCCNSGCGFRCTPSPTKPMEEVSSGYESVKPGKCPKVRQKEIVNGMMQDLTQEK